MTIVIGSRMGGSYSFCFVLYERPFLFKFINLFQFLPIRKGQSTIFYHKERQRNWDISIIGKTDICMQLRIIKNA